MQIFILFILLMASSFCRGYEIEAKMLSQGVAVILVDGKQYLLRDGKSTPEGIVLLSSSTKEATIMLDGKRINLQMSHTVGRQFAPIAQKEMRIAGGDGGHFRASVLINGKSVECIVDTGATSIAMNHFEAERLGIEYLGGETTKVSTANGVIEAFIVTLPTVTLGNIVVHQVTALVSSAESPTVMLLGNSFLSKVNLSVDNGVLILKQK
jgi:aspartyl protease family protein